jgi:IgGFc binding protein
MTARIAALMTMVATSVLVACAAASGDEGGAADRGGSPGANSTSSSGGTGVGTGGSLITDGGGSGGFAGDPASCDQAAQAKSYVGCDFWPTVTANFVWSEFDFAVVVANTQSSEAEITIERNGAMVTHGAVQPDGLQKFYLPWVPELKGPDFDECAGIATEVTTTLRAPGGAYHLTSTVPVTVYQFNALEYRGQGGDSSKNWAQCPGNYCSDYPGCYSYSNDASLLLPTTALTQSYRVTSMKGWQDEGVPAYFAVTGTADGTTVKVQVSSAGEVAAGGGVPATGPGGVFQFSLARGEVVEVMGTPSADLSGSLIQSSAPVQVVAGMACIYLPNDQEACDHIEETVFPAESLGKHYFVTMPTGPDLGTPGHIVRLYGNVDGTALGYAPQKPAGAPDTINAGEVYDLGIVKQSFEITGSHELAVASFQLGGTVVDPSAPYDSQRGDPSQSQMTAVEQFRSKYVFLAPDDYDVSIVDVVAPDGASLVLDGQAVTAPSTPIASGYSVVRAKLGPGTQGAHVLVSDQPVGIQVMGYGMYTSYQYPGGSNLAAIAPPPPPIQ